ncbi:MAG: hypothetical protein MZU95_13195 [Desulfomicrobium escambiense]|nr:hypothetical protein [Desulfomicrobium escambiense]
MMRRLVPLLLLSAPPGLGRHDPSVVRSARHAEPVPDPGRRLRADLGLLAGPRTGRLGPVPAWPTFRIPPSARPSGLSFFSADLGLDYLVPSGAKSAFYFAAGGEGSFYSQDYAAFSTVRRPSPRRLQDLPAPSSILKLQWQGVTLRTGTRLFDFVSHIASLSIDKYFPTRTTPEDGRGVRVQVLPPPVPAGAGRAPDWSPLVGGAAPIGGRIRERDGRRVGARGTARAPAGAVSATRAAAASSPASAPAGGGAGIGHVVPVRPRGPGPGRRRRPERLGRRGNGSSRARTPFLSVEEFYLVANPSADAFSWEGPS